jgi:hypothetical protein
MMLMVCICVCMYRCMYVCVDGMPVDVDGEPLDDVDGMYVCMDVCMYGYMYVCMCRWNAFRCRRSASG